MSRKQNQQQHVLQQALAHFQKMEQEMRQVMRQGFDTIEAILMEASSNNSASTQSASIDSGIAAASSPQIYPVLPSNTTLSDPMLIESLENSDTDSDTFIADKIFPLQPVTKPTTSNRDVLSPPLNAALETPFPGIPEELFQAGDALFPDKDFAATSGFDGLFSLTDFDLVNIPRNTEQPVNNPNTMSSNSVPDTPLTTCAMDVSTQSSCEEVSKPSGPSYKGKEVEASTISSAAAQMQLISCMEDTMIVENDIDPQPTSTESQPFPSTRTDSFSQSSRHDGSIKSPCSNPDDGPDDDTDNFGEQEERKVDPR